MGRGDKRYLAVHAPSSNAIKCETGAARDVLAVITGLPERKYVRALSYRGEVGSGSLRLDLRL